MDRLFNLYPLHVLRTVARCGSVTRAAQELFISQPAVSTHIRGLEARYGESLFERRPRGMAPTPAGAVAAEYANRLFAQMEDMDHAVNATRGQVCGEIRIAASSTPGAYLLPGVLRRFQQCHPSVRPTLMVGESARVLTLIHDYQVPLGVLGELPRMGTEEELRYERMGADELRLTTTPDNPLCQVERIEEDQLRDQCLLIRERGSSTRAGAESVLRGRLEKFDRVMEVESAEALKEAVVAGLGVAVLSSLATEREEKDGLLRPVRDPGFRQRRPFYLVCRADRPPAGAVDALWRFILETPAG